MSGVRNYLITTVIEPATCFDLTTLLNVKTDIGLDDDTDASTDIYLKRVIRQTSKAIAQYCNLIFPLQTYQDVFRPQQDWWPVTIPNGQAPLVLARSPLVDVTSIVVKDGTTDVTLVEDTDFEIDPQTGEIWRLDNYDNPRRWDAVKTVVVYRAGFTLPGQTGTDNQLEIVAPDLEDAAIRLIKARWLAKDRDPYLKTDTVDGVGTQTYWIPNSPDGNMPPDVQDILDNYRVPVIA